MASKSILVVSLFRPEVIEIEEDGEPRLDHAAKRNDDMDLFNHPRYRRAVILKELGKYADAEGIVFENPPNPLSDLTAYQNVHSERLVEFLSTAWKRWHDLGVHGQDEAFSHGDDDDDDTTSSLVPGSHILPRDPHQRPSKSVMGQIAFFCTDIITPVFAQLKQELLWDGAVVQQAVASVQKYKVVYALATHPGHHSSSDAFGGYCYLNHAAFAARLLQGSGYSKVAVLDVDYVRKRKCSAV